MLNLEFKFQIINSYFATKKYTRTLHSQKQIWINFFKFNSPLQLNKCAQFATILKTYFFTIFIMVIPVQGGPDWEEIRSPLSRKPFKMVPFSCRGLALRTRVWTFVCLLPFFCSCLLPFYVLFCCLFSCPFLLLFVAFPAPWPGCLGITLN